MPGTIVMGDTLGLSFLTPDTLVTYVSVVYAIRMFGISMLMMPLTTSGLNSLAKNYYAHGNTANNTLRQVARSIGTSIIITLMSKASISSGLTNPAQAQVHGMNISFAATAALTLVGLVIAFFVVKKKQPIA